MDTDNYKPLSAVATSITTIGINENFELSQETKPIESEDEIVETGEDSSEADIAAEFANTFLMHRHRGVINCDSYYVIFGNDGYDTDQRSRKEASEVWGALREFDPQIGNSSDGTTWAIVLTDHSRSLFDEEGLNRLVWDTWMRVCDELTPAIDR